MRIRHLAYAPLLGGVAMLARADDVTDLHKAAQAGNVAKIESLLARGVNVNAPDRSGATPLMRAALGAHLEAVNVLLAKGADVNAAGTSPGATPLAFAAEAITNVKALTSNEGLLLHAARKGGRKRKTEAAYGVVKALLAAGADIDSASSFIDPEYPAKMPSTVAIIDVSVDLVDPKQDEGKALRKVENAIREGLRTHSYAPMKYGEAQKLLSAAGVPASVALPACQAVKTDAVMAVRSARASSKEQVVARGAAMVARMEMRSCRDGALLWKRDHHAKSTSIGLLNGLGGWDMLRVTNKMMETLPNGPKQQRTSRPKD